VKIKVDECPAGPAMDAAVAEALGWENLHWKEMDRGPNHYAPEGWWGDGPNGECYLAKSYSTDITAAWELWSNLCTNWFHAKLTFNDELHVTASLYRDSKSVQYADSTIEAMAEDGMLAICRVFLKANGVGCQNEHKRQMDLR
jgi:hypothetical protein